MKDDEYEFQTEISKELWKEIHNKAANRYSQFGEDGITRDLTERIGVTNEWCVEVGAADGVFCSNTRQFVEDGWTAVLIEKDEVEFKKLIENTKDYKNCICKNIEIEPNGRHCLDEILRNAPASIELLSLDLDGGEYHVWNGLIRLRPKIVIIEHSRKTTDDDYVPKYGSNEPAGYKALIKLGTAKGYSLIDIPGHNLIFVDKAYLKVSDNQRTKDKIMETKTEVKTEIDDMKCRLNLGAGDTSIDGFVNIDRKTGDEVYPLNYSDDSVDEIRASHILEHFDYADGENLIVLKHWFDKLKPGGVMKIAVPDFDFVCRSYTEKTPINTVGYIMGGHTDINDYHRSIYDKAVLTEMMTKVGLTEIQSWDSELQDCASLPVSLNLMGFKPNGEVKETPEVIRKETENGTSITTQVDCSKIGAVMSMPRLAFADNMFCAMQTLAPMMINLRQGMGVFWGQILTRSMQEVIDEGKEFILTIDYDTYFTKEQFLYLYYLITTNPDIDAILPVQIRREGECAMAGLVRSEEVPEGMEHPPVDSTRFTTPLTQIVTGHFGLTILRVSALKKLSHPWFLGVPNSEGKWEKNRLDEDIYFWNHMHDENHKVFLANEIKIGHMQLMCTYPDTLENGWQPVHKYITEIRKDGLPEHCLPKLNILKQKNI